MKRSVRFVAVSLAMALSPLGCGDDDDRGNENGNNNNQISVPCGNGVVDPGEECDNGAANSDVDPDACRTTCRDAHCGDGVQDTGEECDDGNSSNGDGCLTAGTSAADRCRWNVCGDGWVDPTPTGDGSAVEACDDGNTLDGDDCSSDCQQDLTTCGNGDIDQGETCDDGAASHSDTLPNTCRTSCQVPWCGDGVLDNEYGETCDGSALGGMTCESLGLPFVGGTLECDPETCDFDTSGCVECIATPEICDGLDNDCDGVADNGFDLASDVLNCGYCTLSCHYGRAHSVMECVAASCRFVACEPGYSDANGDVTDGCEADCTPTGAEVCGNSLDDNCDGYVDEGC